ncbi:MAG: phage tail tip lysozyme [Candidatus Saccharimonadales bacterium]
MSYRVTIPSKTVLGILVIICASLTTTSVFAYTLRDFYTHSGINNYDHEASEVNCVTPDSSAAPTPTVPVVASSSNAQTAYTFLIGNGLTPQQAAGVIGNLMWESGMNPTALNPSGAYGIAQWLGGRKTKLQALSGYDTIAVQLPYLWGELTGPYSSVLAALRATTTVESATRIILERYEIPCVGSGAAACFNTEMSKRLPLANQALQQFSGITPPTGGTSATPTTTSIPSDGCPDASGVTSGATGNAGTATSSTTSPSGAYNDQNIPCPTGTTDAGIVKTKYAGSLSPTPYPTIHLCTLGTISNATVNAAVAAQFQKLGELANAAGRHLTASSSFRLNDSCGGTGNGDACAKPGQSMHQIGIAIDFSLVDRHKGTSTSSCALRSTSNDPRWLFLRDNAPALGIKQYTYENWHWDTSGLSNRC